LTFSSSVDLNSTVNIVGKYAVPNAIEERINKLDNV
jgi:hypothetical protein